MVTKSNESALNQLQFERRELEVELTAIDSKLRDAINNGDLVGLETLTKRKAELPKLFIAASMAETTTRHDIVNAEDEVNLKALGVAEAKRDKLKAALEKRQHEIEVEFAAMKV